MSPPRKRDDNWIDGLRGVASFIVVTGHICTSFVPHLHNPAMEENGPSSLFQLPFLRLCVSGRGAVAIFFIITGFVNSINPVKNTRADNTHIALTNLARSTFTRSGRLIMPTSIATCIGWLLCQLGAFKLTGRADATWIRNGGLLPEPNLGLGKLIPALTLFWSSGAEQYDGTYWTLTFFLSASFRVYLALLAMALVTKRSWRFVTLFLYIYSWASSDYLVGMNIYAGLMLAQLQVDIGSRATSMLPRFVPAIIITLGLFICSFPQDNHHWAPWSRHMRDFLTKVTPGNTDISRHWVSIGVTTLMIGIFFSKNARRFLTLPLFNFLGRVSFPIYLLHNILMRTVLVWMVYGKSAAKTPQTDDQGNLIHLERASPMSFIFILPCFYAILYLVGYSWSIYVDPFCAKVVDWLKSSMFKEEPASEKVIPFTNLTQAA